MEVIYIKREPLIAPLNPKIPSFSKVFTEYKNYYGGFTKT